MIMTFCLITVVQALYFLFHPFSKEGCSVSLNLLNRESNVYPYFLFSNKLPKLSRNQLAHGVNLILMLSCMFHCGFKERENGNSTPHVRILLDHQLYILISAATQYMIWPFEWINHCNPYLIPMLDLHIHDKLTVIQNL